MKRRHFVRAITVCAAMAVAAPSQAQAQAQLQSQSAGPDAGTPCYMLVMGTVTDRESFKAYSAALPPLYARFGGRYLAIKRGPPILEGVFEHESVLISAWPNCAAAQAFWTSPAYRDLAQMRHDWGRFSVVLVEGLPAPPTPAGAGAK